MRLFFIVLLYCLLSLSVNAQKRKLQFLKKDTVSKSEGFFLFPLLYYTPDTRFAAGLVGVYYFNTGDKKDSTDHTRLSYTKLLGDYTQNKQLDFWSSWNIFTKNEKYLFKGELRFRNFPDKFYGIGNQSKESDVEFYSHDFFKFKVLAMKQVYNKLFLGFDYQFESEYNFILDPNGELAKGNIVGYKGGIGSAIGAVLTYDTRDNVVNAYSGMLLEGSSYFNSSILGSTFDFVNVNFEFSKYWEIKKNHVVAINTVLNSNFGPTPFIDMAKVGGDGILRGYASNRFRDLHFAGSQIEYRFPLFWRFGMVLFSGVGDVFRTPTDISLNSLKYSFGAGLRFAINPKERLNVRFDYGFGRKSNAFYIMLTEAF